MRTPADGNMYIRMENGLQEEAHDERDGTEGDKEPKMGGPRSNSRAKCEQATESRSVSELRYGTSKVPSPSLHLASAGVGASDVAEEGKGQERQEQAIENRGDTTRVRPDAQAVLSNENGSTRI